MPITRAYASAAQPGNAFLAGKNKIINGDFGIWQRGTSFSLTTADVYNADRWTQFTDVNPTSASITRETFTAGTAPVAGYEGQYFHRTTITTRGSSTYYILAQRIEDCRTFANQTITVSFWARLNSGAVSTSRIRVSQNFGSGGSATVTTDNSYNFTPTATWTRFSLTIPVPSISGKTIGSGSYLQIDAVVPYSAANTVDFWGFQAEAGSVATPFQTATGTLAGELAACQRYYQSYPFGNSDNYASFANGYCGSSTQAICIMPFLVQMRVNPTITYSAANTFGVHSGTVTVTACTSISNGRSSAQNLWINAYVASGLTANAGTVLLANNSTSAKIEASAEL